tara:strand:- start:1539 stop:1838 length:300 start_codon:yes stop_codon:yes gene_type:complete
MSANLFAQKMKKARDSRNWTQADLARQSGLTQAEISRVESGSRLPTMRIVKGLAEAFSSSSKQYFNEPTRYEFWVSLLVDIGERVRAEARSGPGRWVKR